MPDPQTPLREAAARFVAWTVAVGMSPETARIRRAALDRFAAWCDGQAVGSPAQLTHNHLEAYQGYLAAYQKADGNLIAASTRAARMNPVLAFCRWLSRESLVEDDPGKRLVMPRQVRRLPSRVPTVQEIDEMLAEPDPLTPSGIRDRAVLETLYSTALRRMELARLELRDLNLDALLVYVRSGKGARDRVVPLGERAAQWIHRYLGEVRPLLSNGPGDRTLFLTDYGERFEKNRLGDMVRRHVVNSGFPGRGACHLFRHSCATHMLENGADIRFIQEMLGHAQLSTTEIYTRVSIGKLKDVHRVTHPAWLPHDSP
jgi:integrase/recombinase XerD